jgi:hypothetical protein
MSKFVWVLEWTDLIFINFLLRICLNKWESECCLNPNFLTVIPVQRISKEAGLKQVVMLKHTAAWNTPIYIHHDSGFEEWFSQHG